MNQAKGQFQVSLPQFKKNLGDMMITIDDSFIKMLSETLTTKLSAIELSTMDALNQSIPAPIEAALKRNKMQIEGFNSTIKDLQGSSRILTTTWATTCTASCATPLPATACWPSTWR